MNYYDNTEPDMDLTSKMFSKNAYLIHIKSFSIDPFLKNLNRFNNFDNQSKKIL